jgi:hypothetical protein
VRYKPSIMKMAPAPISPGTMATGCGNIQSQFLACSRNRSKLQKRPWQISAAQNTTPPRPTITTWRRDITAKPPSTYDAKEYALAAREVEIAHGHTQRSVFHGDEAAKHHVEHFGKSGPTAEIS